MRATYVARALSFLAGVAAATAALGEPILIDHHDTDLWAVAPSALKTAKASLHIAYGHTSHGSQLTTGMSSLVGFINGGGLGLSYPLNFFAWNNGGTGGALDLHDYFQPGDLGNPDRTTWAARTREYLNNPANTDVNVVIWSWCGQADTTEANINLYLSLMDQLEQDYADVAFVYMTGHVNGCSTTGNLFLRNQQIRDYCAANSKILYDFADIESWDPDGNYYGDKLVLDDCSYDSDGNGTRDRNWALDWQSTHTLGMDWYDCSAAHSQALNGNRKAYAAWALWGAIAGPATLHWTGSESGAWDIDQAVNWSDAGASDTYWEGAHVIFDGTAPGTPLVNVATTVHPASVLVDSDGVDFEFGGPGAIAGPCGLTKNGSGTLTIATSNAYTGETRISAGTLVVASAGALGAGVVRLGDATAPSDAALLVAGEFTVDRHVTVQDDGSGSSTRTLGGTNTLGTAVFSGDITLEADVTLAAALGGEVRLTGALDNAEGHTLTKAGGGTLILDGVQSHGPGALLDILAGTVFLNTDAGSGTAAALSISVTDAALYFGCDQHLDTLTLGDGGKVVFAGARVVVLEHLVMDGVDLGGTTLTPEPATLALLALGGLGVLVRRRGA